MWSKSFYLEKINFWWIRSQKDQNFKNEMSYLTPVFLRCSSENLKQTPGNRFSILIFVKLKKYLKYSLQKNNLFFGVFK